MGLYQAVKRTVPLEWKLAFHKRRTLPRNMAIRVGNQLKGQPPLPPPNLIFLITGDESPKWFLDSGRSDSEAIRELLAKHDLKIEQFSAVLDFGYGVGRIMRCCAVFHPRQYVHETIAQGFEVIDFVAGSDEERSVHDVHLVRKPL